MTAHPWCYLISCSTFKLSHGQGIKVKYPLIKFNYESMDAPGMFFIGTVTHSLDMRKSAGGFVHGFRYTGELHLNYSEICSFTKASIILIFIDIRVHFSHYYNVSSTQEICITKVKLILLRYAVYYV